MEWFRFYHDAVDDPKVQRLSPQLFKHWVNLLCLASRNRDRGTLPSVSDLAFGLRLSETKVRAILRDLQDAGLIDGDGETLQMHGWANRQKRSDNVSERVARHRSSNGACNVTDPLPETLPHVRVTETETETEQRQNRDTPPIPPKGAEYTPEFEAWFQDYPKGRGSKKQAFDIWRRMEPDERSAASQALPLFKQGGDWKRGYHPAPEVWLRGKRWENPPEPEVDEAELMRRAFLAGASAPPQVARR